MRKPKPSPLAQFVLLLIAIAAAWYFNRPEQASSRRDSSSPIEVSDESKPRQLDDSQSTKFDVQKRQSKLGDADTKTSRSSVSSAPQVNTDFLHETSIADYYLLALSWSPSYCLDHSQDRNQCNRRDLGFVVHGLWPEVLKGRLQRDCNTEPVDDWVLDAASEIFPTRELALHEWRAHGSCSGLNPQQYFTATQLARDTLIIPNELSDPKHPPQWRFEKLERSFLLANPRLDPHAISFICGKGVLQEVRICFDRNIQLGRCEKRQQDRCRDLVRIPASR